MRLRLLLSTRGWVVAVVAVAVPLAAAPSDPVAIRVGGTSWTLSEVRARLAALGPVRPPRGPVQTSDAPAAHLDRMLVPDLLLEEHARALPDGLGAAARARALAHLMEVRSFRAASVSDEEVAAYFEAHRSSFQRPAAIAIWRIVTDTEQAAREVLAELSKSQNPVEAWSKLAGERSVDGATKLRRGDLGFVFPDGHTAVPQVKVNPVVYQRAASLADGELLAEPIADGTRFAAIWRRGSRPALAESLDDVRDEIRRVLLRRQGAQALDSLVQRLRQQHLSVHAPDALSTIDYPEVVSASQRPSAEARPAESPPRPSTSAGEER